MYEPSYPSDAGLPSVIVPNSFCNLDSNSLSISTMSSTMAADVYSRMTHAAPAADKQKQQHRRKSDSDAPQLPSSCHSSPSPSHLSQPVSPNSYGIINCVAGITIHEDFSKPTERITGGPGPAQVCRVQPLSALMPPGSEGFSSEDPPPSCESVEPQSPEAPPSPGRSRPRGVPVPLSSMPCMICGDRSTGKHYGAFSCDGCKGFFRRSIRKKTGYRCRFNHECKMTKDMRNQCRDCRLRKCISAGMKKEAVQNERDRITHRRTGAEGVPSPSEGGLSVDILMQAERQCKQQAPPAGEAREHSQRRLASVMDVANSVKQQLLVLVEWAKAIPSFASMHLDDKIKLLKAHSGEHLLLGIAWRSLNTDRYLLLGNDKLILRLPDDNKVPHGRFSTDEELSVSNINWIATRVLDDVVKPLRQHKVDEKEFMCLRTMIFFDPLLNGLTDPAMVHSVRLQAQLLLEDYIMERQDVESRGRFGQIMFMLPYLQTIASAMIHQIQLAKMDGFAGVDTLISEMLLSSADGSMNKEVADVVHPTLAPPPPHRSILKREPPLTSPERSLLHHNLRSNSDRYNFSHNHDHEERASSSPDRQVFSHLEHLATSPDQPMHEREHDSSSPCRVNLQSENVYTSPDGTVFRYSPPGRSTLQHHSSPTPSGRECLSAEDADESCVPHHPHQQPTLELCDQRADSVEMQRVLLPDTSEKHENLVLDRDGKRVGYLSGKHYARDVGRSPPSRDYPHEMEYSEYTERMGHHESQNLALYRDPNQPKTQRYGSLMHEPCDLSPYSSCTSSGDRSPAVQYPYSCSSTGDRSPEEQLHPLNLQQVPD